MPLVLICVAVRARTKFSEKKKSCVDERPKERPIGARRRCSRRVTTGTCVCIYNNDIF